MFPRYLIYQNLPEPKDLQTCRLADLPIAVPPFFIPSATTPGATYLHARPHECQQIVLQRIPRFLNTIRKVRLARNR